MIDPLQLREEGDALAMRFGRGERLTRSELEALARHLSVYLRCMIALVATKEAELAAARGERAH